MDGYMRTNAKQILDELKSRANPRNVEGMARFGINPKNALGISVTELRKVARPIGKSHSLAQQLWGSGVHEAKILAAIIDEPSKVTEQQMEAWVGDFDSWDICDQACTCLFDRTPYAIEKAVEWSHRKEEFVKRAGFVLMAGLAVHDKTASNEVFMSFFDHVKRESCDDRKYVMKAVNWALRQIGKRNQILNKEAIRIATEISGIDSRSAKWVASDALRELRGEAVQRRLRSRPPAARPERHQQS
ncbi:MAG: DNA alkylation repair protein [Methanobacteriota archaeon]|nr:MAG: DNA alkylation repair protein [Euryarchaeota archaeon]